MQKKKLLVIPPDTPHPTYINSIISPLAFLEDQYNIDTIDSLSIMEELSNEPFYSAWQAKLLPYLSHYDAFLGFSLGGVILQQCFSLFEEWNKPIILFSTPSFADPTLIKKLTEVIALCKEYKVNEAQRVLYQQVYYPNEPPPEPHQIINNTVAAHRIIFGLTRVLTTDSTSIIRKSEVNHYHLIGELSHLVNKSNVITPAHGTLISVPKAGMRVLRDNGPFCQKVIWEALQSGT